MLYEISGKGSRSKSYILATNRYVEMQFIDTIPNVFKCFSRCNKVITEFAMQDYEAIAALRQAALLPDSVKLTNFYSEKEYTYIDNALRINIGMGLDQLCRMKPSYLTEMFRTELMKQWLGYDEQKSMENFFESVALERNIPENEVKQERAIREMYRDGRLTDLAYQVEGPNNTTSLSYSDYKVYCARNQQWVKRLQPYLADGGAFITLNAVFLGGEKGLLQQLRAAGYRVRPVNRGRQIKNNIN